MPTLARPPLQQTFHGATSFNGDLSRWDVSKVICEYGSDYHDCGLPRRAQTPRQNPVRRAFNGDLTAGNVSMTMRTAPHRRRPPPFHATTPPPFPIATSMAFSGLDRAREHVEQRLPPLGAERLQPVVLPSTQPARRPPPPLLSAALSSAAARGADSRARRRSLASLREASSRFIGGPARIRVAGAHLLEPFVVDGAFGASELTLEAGSDDATLGVAGGGGMLLHVGEGAPPITLAGFVIHGGVVLNSTDANSRLDSPQLHMARPHAAEPACAGGGRRSCTQRSGCPRGTSRLAPRGVPLPAHVCSRPRAWSGGDGQRQPVRIQPRRPRRGGAGDGRDADHRPRRDRAQSGDGCRGCVCRLRRRMHSCSPTRPCSATTRRRRVVPSSTTPAASRTTVCRRRWGHWAAGAYTCSQDAVTPCNWEKNDFVDGLVVFSFPQKFGEDYPYACPAGAHGEGLTIGEQTAPVCSGLCPAGSAALERSVSCSTCHQGTYTASRGMAQCIPCPYRLSSPNGSTSCSVCADGFFLVTESNASGDLLSRPDAACPSCPENAACAWNTTLETLRVLPGHWRLSSRSRVMTKCEGANAADRCRGGVDAGVDGEGYCGDLYAGPECKLCRMEGFHLENGECRECPEAGPKIAILCGVLVAFAAVAISLFGMLPPHGQSDRIPSALASHSRALSIFWKESRLPG